MEIEIYINISDLDTSVFYLSDKFCISLEKISIHIIHIVLYCKKIGSNINYGMIYFRTESFVHLLLVGG